MPGRRFSREPAKLLLRKAVGNSACMKVLRQALIKKKQYQRKILQMKQTIEELGDELAEANRMYDMLSNLSLKKETLQSEVHALEKRYRELAHDIHQLRKKQ